MAAASEQRGQMWAVGIAVTLPLDVLGPRGGRCGQAGRAVWGWAPRVPTALAGLTLSRPSLLWVVVAVVSAGGLMSPIFQMGT